MLRVKLSLGKTPKKEAETMPEVSVESAEEYFEPKVEEIEVFKPSVDEHLEEAKIDEMVVTPPAELNQVNESVSLEKEDEVYAPITEEEPPYESSMEEDKSLQEVPVEAPQEESEEVQEEGDESLEQVQCEEESAAVEEKPAEESVQEPPTVNVAETSMVFSRQTRAATDTLLQQAA